MTPAEPRAASQVPARLLRLGAVALALAVPVLLWATSLRLAVARAAVALAGPDDSLRAQSEDELAALGAAAVPDLVRLFSVPPASSLGAARSSGTAKEAGPLTLPVMDFLRSRPDPDRLAALVAALDDDDSDVRHYTGLVLAWIGAPAVPALQALLRESPDARRRTSAAWILSNMGADGVPALPALQAALDDPDPDARHMARYAIGQLSPGNEAYWEMVRSMREKPR